MTKPSNVTTTRALRLKNCAQMAVVASALALGLAGCYGKLDNANFFTDGVPASFEMDKQQKQMADKGIYIAINHFTDQRVPASFVKDPDSDILVDYDPDTLPGNAPGYVRAVMERYFEPDPDAELTSKYLAEVDLKYMKMRTITGNFISGPGGRYEVKLEARVRVRDASGNVLIRNKLYTEQFDASRRLYEGEQLTENQDWKNMMKTTHFAIERLAYDVGDDLMKTLKDHKDDALKAAADRAQKAREAEPVSKKSDTYSNSL